MTPESKRIYIYLNAENETIDDLSDHTDMCISDIRCFINRINKKSKYKLVTKPKMKREIPVIWERPESIYTNIRSPYGIADELYKRKIV